MVLATIEMTLNHLLTDCTGFCISLKMATQLLLIIFKDLKSGRSLRISENQVLKKTGELFTLRLI